MDARSNASLANADGRLALGSAVHMTRRQALRLIGLGCAAGAAAFSGAGRLARAAEGASASADAAGDVLYAAFDNPFDGSGTGLWGLVDKTGAWAVKPQFAQFGSMPAQTVALCLGAQGATLSQRYADAMLLVPGTFGGKLLPAQEASEGEDGLWGYIDRTGAWAVQPQFAQATCFSEGFALVEDTSGDLHYIDESGQDPFGALDCATATCFCQGRAFLQGTRSGDGWGCIDASGAWAGRSTADAMNPYAYDIPLVFSTSGLARELKQYLDTSENVVVDFDESPYYERAVANDFAGCDYHEGLLFFDHYVFDTALNQLAPTPFDTAYAQEHDYYYLLDGAYYKDGTLACEDWRWELWGYLDPTGAWALPCRYMDAQPFSEGLAFAQDAGTGAYGFVDETGTWAIAPRFALPEGTPGVHLGSCFVGGCAFVSTTDDAANCVWDGWVDATGAWVTRWSHWTGAIKEPEAYAGQTPAWKDDLTKLAGTYVMAYDGADSLKLDITSVASNGEAAAHISVIPDEAEDYGGYRYDGMTYDVEGNSIECDLTGTFVACVTEEGEPRVTATLAGDDGQGGGVVLGVSAGGDGYAEGDVDGVQTLQFNLFGAHTFKKLDASGSDQVMNYHSSGVLEVAVAPSPTKR